MFVFFKLLHFSSKRLLFLLLLSSQLFCNAIGREAKNPPSDISENSFIWIGDPGNDPYGDTISPQIGTVDEGYKIEKYKTTVSQWNNYLNATRRRDEAVTLLEELSSKMPITNLDLLEIIKYTNWRENNSPTREELIELAKKSCGEVEDLVYEITHTGAYTITENREENVLEIVSNPEATYHIATTSQLFKAFYYQGNGIHAGYILSSEQNSAPPVGYSSIAHNSKQENFPLSAQLDDAGQNKSSYGVYDVGSALDEWTLADESYSEKIVIDQGIPLAAFLECRKSSLDLTSISGKYDLSYKSPLIGFRLVKKEHSHEKNFTCSAPLNTALTTSNQDSISSPKTVKPENASLSIEEKQKAAAKADLVLESCVIVALAVAPFVFPPVLPLEWPLMTLYFLGVFGFARQTLSDIIMSL